MRGGAAGSGSAGRPGRSPEVFAELLPLDALPAPTTFTLFPVTLTGRSTGSCTPFPDSTPGESCVPPTAVAPPEESGRTSRAGESSLTQVLPAAELRSPTTFTVLPHTFTGTCTGSWMVFPDPTPGEPAATPSAPASAYAGIATAIAPDAAATAITPFRVTRLIGSLPSRHGRERSPAPDRTRLRHPGYGSSVCRSPFTPSGAPRIEPRAKTVELATAERAAERRPPHRDRTARHDAVRPTGGGRGAHLG
ncbi:hypothetical protein SSRG_00500 [Streptomyces griseoflavus Tu4000]|uniref:Uncharacterized protein n=1 Tax=Streptomyces griseoflavus Tu4000 TaxID=467200 RepID=D9XUY5_9ACTN|nr:hypothetical protein SSRG_00500 [Streptomyces griseoflavus Tu4000]